MGIVIEDLKVLMRFYSQMGTHVVIALDYLLAVVTFDLGIDLVSAGPTILYLIQFVKIDEVCYFTFIITPHGRGEKGLYGIFWRGHWG